MRFFKMQKPLAYPVFDGDHKVIIPAGAEDVEIAFQQSRNIARNSLGTIVQLKATNGVVPFGFKRCNVYKYAGKTYHA